MAKKKGKKTPENYFNNISDWQTEAEPRTVTPEGVPVFCAYDELVSIGKCVPNPGNPNTHPPKQISLLAAIIKGQGWRKPITISKRSGFVVSGHGRLEAAQVLGASVVPVEYQQYSTEAEEYADLMADNRIAELAEMNTSALADMLQSMDTGEIPLEMSGYTAEDLEDLLNALGGLDDTENKGEDSVPPPRNIPMTHAGDIWCLGQHRLICGDSTKPETLQLLMGEERAQCVNTDPPYGISLDGGGGNGKRQKEQIKENGMIANDELTDDDLMVRLLIPAFKNAMKYSKPDAAFYIYHATDTRRDFEDAMTAAGMIEKQYLIWLKNNHNLSGTGYLRDFEPIFYAEKAGHTAKWCGDRSNNTCWKVTLRDDTGMATTLSGGVVLTDGAGGKIYMTEKPPKGKKVRYLRVKPEESAYLYSEEKQGAVWEVAHETNRFHPTQKPVELALKAIMNSSEPGDVILDLFGGSGFTLIGAEMAERQARIVEMDPIYCDGIVRRYVAYTGNAGVTCTRNGKEYPYVQLNEENLKLNMPDTEQVTEEAEDINVPGKD